MRIPIDSFLLENEDGTELWRLRIVDGSLKQEKRRFTTSEQEGLAQERAERELRRRQMQVATAEPKFDDEDLQQSLVNFWTTIQGFKPPKKSDED